MECLIIYLRTSFRWTINSGEVFQMIGVVSQEPSLFNGSIMDNIRLGRNLNDEEIERAARTANAHDFIMGLEKVFLINHFCKLGKVFLINYSKSWEWIFPIRWNISAGWNILEVNGIFIEINSPGLRNSSRSFGSFFVWRTETTNRHCKSYCYWSVHA